MFHVEHRTRRVSGAHCRTSMPAPEALRGAGPRVVVRREPGSLRSPARITQIAQGLQPFQAGASGQLDFRLTGQVLRPSSE